MGRRSLPRLGAVIVPAAFHQLASPGEGPVLTNCHAMVYGVEGGAVGRFWHVLEDGRIQCDLCPRFCKLHEGQQGLCFVRARHDDRIVLTTYGRSSGFCIDPIEKKPLNHFLPGTSVLSFGTAGCNLTCRFCQNWDISKAREFDRLTEAASPDAIAEAAVSSGARSVAFTYNDPVVFVEYAIDVADACRARGLKTVAVSAGYMCAEPRAEFYRHIDAVNIDLKAFTERFYQKLCSGALAPVLETLAYLKHETSVWLEITTLLIPGENDSPAEIEGLSAWVLEHLGPDVPLHFTAFHPDWKMRDTPPTLPAKVRTAWNIARGLGLRYVYTGNIDDEATQSTYCHTCNAKLIGRRWYDITAWNLTPDGRCKQCGERCAGIFDGSPGDWGTRRMPISIQAI